MRARSWLWLVGCCLTALLPPPPAVAQRRPGVKLELRVPREQFLLGESISVEVRLVNTGAQAVDAPKLKNVQNTQPVYHLKGPSYPKGTTFSLRDVKLAGDEAALRAT